MTKQSPAVGQLQHYYYGTFSHSAEARHLAEAMAAEEDTGGGCAACGGGGLLLSCDRCGADYHLRCAGVDAVPEGDWLCPACEAAAARSSASCSPADPPPAARSSSSSSDPPPAARHQLLWLGDSVVRDLARRGGAAWALACERHECTNLGKAGEETGELLHRVQRARGPTGSAFAAAAAGTMPTVVVLHSGNNDLERWTAHDIATRLRAVAMEFGPDALSEEIVALSEAETVAVYARTVRFWRKHTPTMVYNIEDAARHAICKNAEEQLFERMGKLKIERQTLEEHVLELSKHK